MVGPKLLLFRGEPAMPAVDDLWGEVKAALDGMSGDDEVVPEE